MEVALAIVAPTALSLLVAAGALVLVWRLRRDIRLLRAEEEAVEAYSMRLEKEIVRLERSLPFDGLTGLGNALRLEEDWKRLVARFNRRSEEFAVAVIDLADAHDPDGSLKRESLAQIAETLLEVVRTEDHVYRLGQMRFAVLLSGSDLQGARAFVERTRRRLTEKQPDQAPGEVRCTVEFGVAEWGKGLTTLASFLGQAAKDRDASRTAPEPRPLAARLARVSGPKKAIAA